MQVDVGPFVYEVELVRGYVQYRGEPCLGLCDHLAKRIMIADVMDRSQRLHVFLHELFHAWQHHQPGRIDDEEAMADLVATSMTRLILDVTNQPGMLELFDRPRGRRGSPLDPPPEGEVATGPVGSGVDERGEAMPVRVRRVVVDGGAEGAKQPGWVIRIFEAEDGATGPRGAPCG